MEKKSRKKVVIISLIIVMLVGIGSLFAYRNHHIATIVQNQKQTFQTQIKAASEPMQKEDKESQLAAINELKKVEAEITAFQQNVYFTEINSASFKEEKEVITKKANEAREHINFLYKVKLDASVKDPKTLSQDEAKMLVHDLDTLLKEIQTDGILNTDVVQTFSDKVSEMKELYMPLFAKSATKEADVNVPVKSEGQTTTPTTGSSTSTTKPTTSSNQITKQESTTTTTTTTMITEENNSTE